MLCLLSFKNICQYPINWVPSYINKIKHEAFFCLVLNCYRRHTQCVRYFFSCFFAWDTFLGEPPDVTRENREAVVVVFVCVEREGGGELNVSGHTQPWCKELESNQHIFILTKGLVMILYYYFLFIFLFLYLYFNWFFFTRTCLYIYFD